MPMWRCARFLALVGVCIFLTSLTLAACGPTPGFTGYVWQVTAISHNGKVMSIPARMQVTLQFSPSGRFGADDSINFHSGTYRTTSDGFTTNPFAVTAVGNPLHRDPALALALGAISSFDNGVHATAQLTGDQLVVGVGSYTLTCQRRRSPSRLRRPG